MKKPRPSSRLSKAAVVGATIISLLGVSGVADASAPKPTSASCNAPKESSASCQGNQVMRPMAARGGIRW